MRMHCRAPQTQLTADIPLQARKWRNLPEVWLWCRQFTLISEGQHQDWLERIDRDPTVKMFGIEAMIGPPRTNRAGKLIMPYRPIGVCGLTSIDRVNQNAEFSLYISPTYQRRGFARDALYLLLQHGFMDQNLNRIWGETYDGNPAWNLFASMGMTHEGTQREAYYRRGKFIDAHIWAITKGDYLAKHSHRPGDGDKRPDHDPEHCPSGRKSCHPEQTSERGERVSPRNHVAEFLRAAEPGFRRRHREVFGEDTCEGGLGI